MEILKDEQFEMIEYQPRYFSQLVELFKISVHRKKNATYFDYNFTAGPFGSPIRFIMMYKNRLVGSHSIRPLPVVIGGKEHRGGQTYDTMTHPEFRRKGIFTALAQKTHQTAHEMGFKTIFGFANPNSIHGYTTKLNHLELKPLNFVAVKDNKASPSSSINIKNHFFPRNVESILRTSESRSAHSVFIKKGHEFLEWRYSRNPEYQYFTAYETNEYFLILKEYENQIQLIDFFVFETSTYKTILEASIQFATKMSKTLTFWLPINHPLMDFVKELDFYQLHAQQHFHVVSLDPILDNEVLDFDKWFYTMGDSDVF